MELGLTKLKARAYLSLLKRGGSTGYQIAKELNEPAANTYKALESLRADGLALLEETAKVKSYAAQPIGTYLDQRERWLARKRDAVEKSLRSLVPAHPDEGFYTIESTDQLYALSSSLIEQASDSLAVDATSFPLELLGKELTKAAGKGLKVLVKTYEDIKIPGCNVVFSEGMGSPVSDLSLHLLHLVVPGEGYIIAITDFDNNRILSGVYVRNLFLSILAYNGFTMELFVTRAFDMLHRGRSGDEVLGEWNALRPVSASRTSAWGDLIKSLGLGAEGAEA